jgi:hypothetical protein
LSVRPNRAFSSSEPLLPETIKLIKENLEKYGQVHFELPHIFVVFGASVKEIILWNKLFINYLRVIWPRKRFIQHFGGFFVMDFCQEVNQQNN